MLIDIRSLPDRTTIETDVCIVGSGPAGIAIAQQLLGTTLKVCVLESGGFNEEQDLQDLNKTEASDTHKFNLSSRRRQWGGTSNMWGGNSAPFDESDIAARDYVPHSRWPISYSELMRYFPRVHQFCQLGTTEYACESWRREIPSGWHPDTESITTKVFQRQQLNFGAQYQNTFCREQSNVDIYLFASALRIETKADGQTVRQLHVGCPRGSRYTVRSQIFILAAGIENARLLLLSRDAHPNGLGNEYDNVGRYLMGHLHFLSGIFATREPSSDFSLYGIQLDWMHLTNAQRRISCAFQVTTEKQREHQISNYAAFLAPLAAVHSEEFPHVHEHANSVVSLKTTRHDPRFLRWKRARAEHLQARTDSSSLSRYVLRNWVEQAPDPHHRVVLGTARDALGQPRLRVEWGLGDLDRKTIVVGQQLLAQYFEACGIGQLFSALPNVSSTWPAHLQQASHFMGTTRMSLNPEDGVVDSSCRVHSLDNLYIAGGSVMPTSGVCMVTCNLLALAIRLADHIKVKLGICDREIRQLKNEMATKPDSNSMRSDQAEQDRLLEDHSDSSPLRRRLSLFSFRSRRRRIGLELITNAVERPIFLIGTARSGTTFLAEQLNRLEEIVYCPFELSDIWSKVGKVPIAAPLTGDQTNPAMNESNVWPGQASALRAAFARELLKTAGLPRRQIQFLNKNPHLCNKLPLVNALFPECHFIWMHRPLLPVVASLKAVFADVYERQQVKHAWPKKSQANLPRGLHAIFPADPVQHYPSDRIHPGGDVIHLANYWLETNQAVSNFMQSLPQDRYSVVSHHDLVLNPEQTLQQLFSSLKLIPSIPQGFFSGVDPTCNQRFESRLSPKELHALRQFESLQISKNDIFGSHSTQLRTAA